MADTRKEILNAARDLFTAKGFEAVSVRDITNTAEVNLASVSYHFGGKDGLIQETLKHTLNPIFKYSIQLLEDAKLKHGSFRAIPLEQIMECWLRPLIVPEECGVEFDLVKGLIARYLVEIDYAVPQPSQQLLSQNFKLYTEALQAHLPQLSSETVTKQLIFIKGAAFYSGGLGGGLIQVINGEKVTTQSIDRRQLLTEVIECAMLGLSGSTTANR